MRPQGHRKRGTVVLIQHAPLSAFVLQVHRLSTRLRTVYLLFIDRSMIVHVSTLISLAATGNVAILITLRLLVMAGALDSTYGSQHSTALFASDGALHGYKWAPWFHPMSTFFTRCANDLGAHLYSRLELCSLMWGSPGT